MEDNLKRVKEIYSQSKSIHTKKKNIHCKTMSKTHVDLIVFIVYYIGTNSKEFVCSVTGYLTTNMSLKFHKLCKH